MGGNLVMKKKWPSKFRRKKKNVTSEGEAFKPVGIWGGEGWYKRQRTNKPAGEESKR